MTRRSLYASNEAMPPRRERLLSSSLFTGDMYVGVPIGELKTLGERAASLDSGVRSGEGKMLKWR